MRRSILIVDDEIDMLKLLKRSLEPDLACDVQTAVSGEKALQLLADVPFDLVLADIKMPGMDGLQLLAAVKERMPEMTVIMMTAHGSIENAVEAMKNGAYDFITKPFDHETLIVRLEKALERSSLLRENRRLKNECKSVYVFQNMVGKSYAMQAVQKTIRMVAQNDFTVLITGESGTGKELAARAVHQMSARSSQPFIAVNCPAIPENILESELFGYRKGAFTNAVQDRKGLFQEADHGSIFLDEIGDISPGMQVKLLRVLQEKEIKPLGSNRSIKIDVRVIASTNRDLKEKIQSGEFREDLYYRLNVLPVSLPPLRERREDIPLIAGYLLERHCADLGKPLKRISSELMAVLVKRSWQGNIRELENVIVQGILFSSSGREIRLHDVGLDDGGDVMAPIKEDISAMPYKQAKEAVLKEFNDRYIGNLLAMHDGNITQAARQCGMERQALQQIMRRYRITARPYRH